MKKIFFSIVALAALAACSKSEVAYDQTPEIGFAPAVENATKAAISGEYPDQPLRVFAVYGGAADQTTITDDNIESFSTLFLNDAIFIKKTVGSVTAWGGTGDGYSWPNNGSLVFAGYAVPDASSVGDVEYDFEDDVLSIEGYVQSTNTASTFDLAWFGRTEKSYNLKATPTQTVPVTLSHALAWIEIKVKGEGTTVGWTIKSITMNNVYNTGDVQCNGNGLGKASWDNLGNSVLDDSSKDNSISIFTGEQTLSKDATLCENINTDALVIPQTPTKSMIDGKFEPAESVATLTVTYTYKSPAGEDMPLQTTIVPLEIKNGDTAVAWQSGYKYTYTLTFKASEILVSPTYDTWTDYDPNPGVTVE